MAEAEEWVEQNVTTLPVDYAGLVKYSMLHRKVIYAKLPLETKVAIWHSHLAEFKANHLLTTQQTLFVDDVDGRLATLIASTPSKESDAVFRAEAAKVLGADNARLAFATLGPEEELQPTYCACSQDSDSCATHYECGTAACTSGTGSCGTLGGFRCDGMCNNVG
jgi:hypothetical protein